MKRQVYNLDNKKVSEIDLPNEIFDIKVLPDLIHKYIRYQNTNKRQGSRKTKVRSEIKGKAKKPFSQKGTGNARQGSSKPPHFRGGAVSMGPQNRDHSFSLNKKEKKMALKSALSIKLSENKIIFLDSLEIKSHKTKDLYKKLEKFNFQSALVIHDKNENNINFIRASSNIPRLSLLLERGLNVKDIISYDKIFIEKNALEQINKRLSWGILIQLSRSKEH